MNAQLRPVAMPICRPTYLNTNLRSFPLWERDNGKAIETYWEALGRALPDGPGLTGFARAQVLLGFAKCQWDQEHARTQ